MSLFDFSNIKNKPTRSGFDLSNKRSFTAKTGELLPVGCYPVLPGDKFNIDLNWFTRTQPLNTSTFTRIREYVDVFYVKGSDVYDRYDHLTTQMEFNKSTNLNSESSINPNQPLPYFQLDELTDFLQGDTTENELGYNASLTSLKLLEYLDYGTSSSKYEVTEEGTADNINSSSIAVNPFPLACYQKIYFDFYRNEQWEDDAPYCYDLSWSNNGQRLSPDNLDLDNSIISLRYANWKKDKFMGSVPKSQFGDISIAKLGNNASLSVASKGTSTVNLMMDNNGMLTNSTNNTKILNVAGLNAGIDILTLRQAEALQRWKEVTNVNDKLTKDQILAHWGVKVPTLETGHALYLGGTSSIVQIGDVMNNNITSDYEATIAGKGTSVGNGKIEYEVKDYGYIMVIYHNQPDIDYESCGLDFSTTQLFPTDFAIPEFDKLGLSIQKRNQLYDANNPDLEDYLGYNSRYIDYKTYVDRIYGDFNYTLRNWLCPITKSMLAHRLHTALDYRFFKVDPQILNPIFARNVSSSLDTDQFLINFDSNIKAVRNLDYDGMPF